MQKRIKGEASVGLMARDLRRKEVTVRLLALGPERVFAGLRAYAFGRQWKPGWAAHAFKEIFGAWPRREDRYDPPETLEGFIVEEWLAVRKKPQRIKAAKSAPLIDRAAEPMVVDASGFVQNTLMTAEDFGVDL